MTCCEYCTTCRLKQPTLRQRDIVAVKITWVSKFTTGYSGILLSKRNVQAQQLEAVLVRRLSTKTRTPNKATTHSPPRPARTPIAQTGNLTRLPGLGVPETKPLPFGTGSFLGLGSAEPAGSMIVAFLRLAGVLPAVMLFPHVCVLTPLQRPSWDIIIRRVFSPMSR
jgi:hypothetical protein